VETMNVLQSTEYTDFMMNVEFFCFLHFLQKKRCLGKRRFSIKLWKTFTDCFNCLPIAALIDEKVLN
jgi:hypothetical protein